MPTMQEREGDDRYEAQTDANPEVSADVTDNSYIKSVQTGEAKQVPVVSDQSGQNELDDSFVPQNSDAQLKQDDREAIDKGSIVSGRTRGAKPAGSYSEGPEENDLPVGVDETGRSDMTRGVR